MLGVLFVVAWCVECFFLCAKTWHNKAKKIPKNKNNSFMREKHNINEQVRKKNNNTRVQIVNCDHSYEKNCAKTRYSVNEADKK